ncbi:hypothetical protein C2S51_015950 [Perilla frutescens var. frutescens]|nr:hypothetical protein C2S51_015950 [Perilla frutescens var. frutescens]
MPEQKSPAIKNRLHMPADLVEEILFRLPMKSVVRFSIVSKSWNSMIFGSSFVKRFRGRKRVVWRPQGFDNFSDALICPLSSISSPLQYHNPFDGATPLVCPFKGRSSLLASCDELWCVEVETSLVLWNHSLRTYRKLPDASIPPWWGYHGFPYFSYGLGYDSVGNDYKILKIDYRREAEAQAELYSLRSDSWRMIQPFPRKNMSKSASFVSGKLHWLVGGGSKLNSLIISFDLSTEKYGEVALPEFDGGDNYTLDTTILRGMLSVYVNDRNNGSFVLWVMEDYESDKSWTKELDINYGHILPRAFSTYWNPLRPFYFYDDDGGGGGGDQNQNKVVVISFIDTSIIYTNTYDSTLLRRNVCDTSKSYVKFIDSFIYVESLVSPDIWPRLRS